MGAVSSSEYWRVHDSLEEGGKEVCEDRIGVCGPLAWVIDGATAVSDTRLTDEASDAAWLADRLDHHLRAVVEDGADSPGLVAVTEELIARVANDAREAWRAQPLSPPSAALGLVRNRGQSMEYLVLADVTLHVRSQGATVTDRRVAESTRGADLLLRRQLSRTGSHEQAMEVVRPSLLASRVEDMNRTDGYWVASTDPSAAAHALTGRLGLATDDRVLLCTDGFSRLWDTFGHFNGPAEVIASGLSAGVILDGLRAAEAGDRECIEHPRWSIHDDAAVLVLSPISMSG